MLAALKRLVPNTVRSSYVLKFAIALLIMGLAVAAVGVAATDQIEGAVEQRVDSDQANIAQQEAEKLSAWHHQHKLVTGMLTDSAIVQDGDVDRIQRYLSRWKTQLNTRNDEDYVYEIHYADLESGTIEASSNQEPPDQLSELNIPDEDLSNLEEAASEQDAYTTDAYQRGEEGSGAPVITIVREVPNNPGHVIVYTIGLAEYADRFQSAGTGRSTTLVLNGDDRIIFDDELFGGGDDVFLAEYGGHGDPGSSAREAGPDTPQSQQITQTPAGALTSEAYDFPDEEYVIGYAQIEGTDWVVVTHRPVSDAYGFVNSISQYGTYATLIGVLLIGLVGAVIGRNTATSIDRLTGKAEAMGEGNLDIDFETDRIDNIGRLYSAFATMQDQLRAQIDQAEAARDDAESARAETERMNEHLEQKADQYREVMDAAGDGDLTARMDATSENEAMEQIGRTFNEMLAEIEATTEHVKTFASDVAAASEEVTASSEEVHSASETVTESVQEISDGASKQNERFQSVSQEMTSLSTTTEQIASSSNEVADIAEQTAVAGREGRQAAQQAIDGMDDIEVESRDAVAEIERLQDEVAQIDELLEFITEVAEQTNLLALNANIEASRSDSGESGDGFAVVAEEVKELAADTKEAAEDIEQRLVRIKDQTDATTAVVRNTADEVSQHADAVRTAAESLDEIAEYAQETNTGIQEISAATEEQAASTEEVVAMVDDAATISEETTAEAENVAAAAEEQTTALTEVSNSASELTGQAARLSEELDRFETETDTSLELETDDELRASTSDGDGSSSTDHSERPNDYDGAADESDDTDDTFTFGQSPVDDRAE